MGVEKGHSVKINVSKIPEGGMEVRFEKDAAWFRELLPKTAPCDCELQKIVVACTVRRMRESVYIEGTVSTNLEAPCSRCLEPSRQLVAAEFKYTFAPSPAEPQEELELSADDLDFAYYEEDTIDLDALVLEQILLQIPIKPLCKGDCKGLCPRCGTNLNVASCGCTSEPFDERLALLKKFKVQQEKP
ncbi:MAG: DUF177 domain-containing protein [Deltaproteobacteria bacterium]|nr:DUF177 domain-containing protein [Deltaproteobacteria bacterium]